MLRQGKLVSEKRCPMVLITYQTTVQGERLKTRQWQTRAVVDRTTHAQEVHIPHLLFKLQSLQEPPQKQT